MTEPAPPPTPAPATSPRSVVAGPGHDEELWFDYHSEELAAVWHATRDKVAEMGVYVLDLCTFPDFVSFCYQMSSGRVPRV